MLDRQDLKTELKCYKAWQFMWLFPPPPHTSCCGAYTEKREGSWHILGWRPTLLPTGKAKGNHQHICLKAWVPATFLLTKPAKKVNGAFLKSASVTLRYLPHPCWGLLYRSQANHMSNTSKSLCSSFQRPVKVGMCYKGRLRRGVAGTFLLILSVIYCRWRELVGKDLSHNWGIAF